MVKDNYQARIYSPYDWDQPEADKQAVFLNGKDDQGNTSITLGSNTYAFDDVTGPVDPYEIHYNEDPMHFLGRYKVRKMPEGTTMVPRVFKTNVGDIFTTNTINADAEELTLGATLAPGEDDGILAPADDGDMLWQVVRVYTLPDNQPAVKIMRIK